MFSYATVKEYWYLLDVLKDYPEFTDLNSLTGSLSEYQRLFVLNQILLALPNGGKILEIGGGYCHVMTAILKRFPDKYECWSIDPLDGQCSGPTFESVRKNIHNKIVLIREKIGTFSKSLQDSYFDFCFSISLLDYIPKMEWKVCFQDMMRVMQKGAIMLHSIAAPVDYPLAWDSLFKLKQISESLGLIPLNKINFEIPDILNDNNTYYVSPAVNAKRIQSMPAGENTLRTAIYYRTTALNAVLKKP